MRHFRMTFLVVVQGKISWTIAKSLRIRFEAENKIICCYLRKICGINLGLYMTKGEEEKWMMCWPIFRQY